ncbi:MAG: hypothetical protein V4543_03780 [Bacteroidota bacterium]
MKTRLIKYLLSALAVPAMAMPLAAQSKLSTVHLSIFKNGVFYRRQEGDISLKNKVGQVEIPENVLKGTYWLSLGKGAKINQVTFEEDTVKKRKTAEYVQEILAANTGKKVTLKVNAGTQKPDLISGTLVSYNRNSGLGRLDTDGNSHFFNGNNVLEAEFADRNIGATYETDTIIRLARVNTNSSADNVPASVISMQTGIQWYPSYYLKLSEGKEARLIMKATLENFAIDADNTEADLIVGDPMLSYGKELDPISTTYLSENAPQPRQITYAPRAYSMAKTTSGVMADAAAPMPEDANYSTAGDQQSDLYFYRTGKINLRKNTKTLLMLNTSTVPFEHVYKVYIGDNNAFLYDHTVNNDWHKQTTAHSVKFTNKSDAPLTEAPVFVISPNDDPLTQNNMPFTSKNAEASVYLNTAYNLDVRSREEEKAKESGAKRVGKLVFDKVTVKSSIKIHNYQDKAITLNTERSVYGTVTSDGGGKVRKSGQYNQQNPYSNIQWTTEVPANGEKIIDYEYQVYIQVNNE